LRLTPTGVQVGKEPHRDQKFGPHHCAASERMGSFYKVGKGGQKPYGGTKNGKRSRNKKGVTDDGGTRKIIKNGGIGKNA